MSATLFCMLNSRIGWPWEYFGQGVGPVFGFLAVYFLMFLGFAALAAGTEEHGCLFAGLAIWLVAGFVLQGLPHTESGIQVIPLPPWSYSAWIARIISAVCWMALVLGCLAALSSNKNDWPGAVAAILVGLSMNALLLSFASPADAVTTVTDGRSSVVTSCREKIAQWETLRRERSETLEKLSSDKEMLATRIRSLRCQTKRELMSHRVGRTLAGELEQLSRQIAQLQTETDTIEATVERAQSMLRCTERQAMLKDLSDEEFARMSQMVHELEEGLRNPSPASEIQTDKLLDEVLASPATVGN
jgi:hypothetical protein